MSIDTLGAPHAPRPEGPPPEAEPPPPVVTVGVPVVLAFLTALVLMGGVNQSWFLSLNRVSEYTGPALWSNITILGDGLVVAVLFLPLVGRRPDLIWAGLIAAAISTGLHELIDGLVHAPRPPAVLAEGTFNVIGRPYRVGSFPSGHTTTLATWAAILILGSRSTVGWVAPAAVAILGGFSRIAVGVHWPADVLAGLCLGWVSAVAGIALATRFPGGAGPKPQKVIGALLLICGVVLLVIDHTGYPDVLLFQRSLALVCLFLGGRNYRAMIREDG